MSYLKRMRNNPHCFGAKALRAGKCKPPCDSGQVCKYVLDTSGDPGGMGAGFKCVSAGASSRRAPMIAHKRLDPLQRKLQANTFKAKRNRR